MSALSLCLMSFEKEISEEEFSSDFFFLKASFLSRIGSGSACRSVYGGFNIWGKHKDFEQSSDLFSLQLNQSISTEFEDFQDTMNIMNEVRYDESFSFIYSPRPNTTASDMEDDVTQEEKKERLNICLLYTSPSPRD